MEEWLKESEQALACALEVIANGEVDKLDSYKIAPILYCSIRELDDNVLFETMCEVNEQQVQTDCALDPSAIQNYKFNFVSSYLYCFVVHEQIDEFTYDDIMEYINDNMELF